MLTEAQRRRITRAAGVRNSEQLEHPDYWRFQSRDAVDPLADIKCEIELSATHAFDPATIHQHGNADDVIPLGSERALDRLDCPENEKVRRFGERGRAVEKNRDLHATA